MKKKYTVSRRELSRDCGAIMEQLEELEADLSDLSHNQIAGYVEQLMMHLDRLGDNITEES